MGWLGDGSHRGQGCQAWTAVGLLPRYPPPQKKMKMGQYLTKIWIELCGLLFWATLKTEQRSGCIWLMAVLMKVRTDTTDFRNMKTAGIKRQIIKNKTKVAGRMSACIEWRVVYFRKLLFETNNKKFYLRRVKSKICRHPGLNLLQSSLDVVFITTLQSRAHVQ